MAKIAIPQGHAHRLGNVSKKGIQGQAILDSVKAAAKATR
jgi:hypothetical protein